MTTTATPLVQEIATYNARKQELLRTAPGRYVVITGTDILGINEDASDAYGQTYRRIRNVPFLLRRIQEQEQAYVVVGSLM